MINITGGTMGYTEFKQLLDDIVKSKYSAKFINVTIIDTPLPIKIPDYLENVRVEGCKFIGGNK